MSFGIDVDTLSLTFDKLQYIFNGFGQIRESFLETTTKYKQEGISDAEFFDKVLEGVMRFSALEFLAIKAVFEIKKSAGTDRMKHGVETTPPPAMHKFPLRAIPSSRSSRQLRCPILSITIP